MLELELKLDRMAKSVRSLNELLSVIREEDYLIIEHPKYGHVVELHEEDYPHHREIVREHLNLVSGD